MSGPDLVVRVAANISALQADMATAAQSVKTIETAVIDASAASRAFESSLDSLGTHMLAAFSVGAVINFAENVVSAG